jgi:hypothetical protein
MKITLELTNDQIDVIMIEELENALGDIELSKDRFSEEWEEDVEAFKRVLGYYKS